MVDTLVLADMEWNGMKYDFDLSAKKAETLTEQLTEIDEELTSLFPIDGINWNSNDHLSAMLYGGVLKVPYRETYEKVLKDGTVRVKERNAVQEIPMDTLVVPLKGTECAKEGYWKTSEDILRSLKTKGKAKQLIDLVLKRSLIDKELNTYATGLPKLYEEKHYTDDIIHGQFNQTVARTGRLSSSKPNMQNLSGTIKECFISRYW
jgi:DNA polymerase I-like protein with 3'-5' exonuclease and polymerase domains